MMSHRGAAYHFSLDEDLTHGLHQLAQKQNTSLYTVLLSVLNILLSRYTGQTDICVGSPIANRNHEAIEPLLGFFVNTLVMRNQVPAQRTFLQFLEQVTQTALNAYAHQDIPFEQLVEELVIERDTSRHPLFQVMLVLQNFNYEQDINLSFLDLDIEMVPLEQQSAKFDLNWHFREVKRKLSGNIEYCTDLFEPETIERMLEHFKMLLQGVIEDSAQPLGQLSLMTEQERHRVLMQWNQTQTDFPQDQTIAQMFQAQVAKTPNHIAVVFEDKNLSYRQLDERSNQLAHYLKNLGVHMHLMLFG